MHWAAAELCRVLCTVLTLCLMVCFAQTSQCAKPDDCTVMVDVKSAVCRESVYIHSFAHRDR